MTLCSLLNSDTITNPPFTYNEAVEKPDKESLFLSLLQNCFTDGSANNV
jgi:hypothetical protein